MRNISHILSENRFEIIIIAFLVVVTAFLHSYNMLNFPYFESDEGTYMSQAWSFSTSGKLSPYKYIYDHPPLGWIFISFWTHITGGIFAFGFSLNSGRVFMLVLQTVSSILLYFIARRLTDSRLGGLLTVLIFSASPLGIYLHRRILLDNIMTFWLLLSLFIILYSKMSSKTIYLSAVVLAIAVLTKEPAIIFLPVYAYIFNLVLRGGIGSISSLTTMDNRSIGGAVIWLLMFLFIVLLYPLLAFIRGELLPSDSGVSLVHTFLEQWSRRSGSFADIRNTDIWINIVNWLKEDPLYIVTGLAASLINLYFGLKNRNALVLSLLSISYWAFLLLSGFVLEFFIIPVLPFMAMNISYITIYLRRLIKRRYMSIGVVTLSVIPALSVAVMLFLMIVHYSGNVKDKFNIFSDDQTGPQKEAVWWLLNNTSDNMVIVIDNYAYIDLNARNTLTGRKFEYYWKVDFDPDISNVLLSNNYNNIDYVAATPQMIRDINNNPKLALTREALKKSEKVIEYMGNEWGVEIHKVFPSGNDVTLSGGYLYL
ncbi:MAG: Glycosyl transferase family 39 [candidate division WWE3 bacterium GW2011_GWC1_41_7]|uniref:Glycosyl transferase family 39 n=1 Tax=candidate division WWE3 bacterium GW2011_GWC1_41_7 TaxID=1619119 RepID=A0A0G0X7V4_UNCKA|nr:MAG: Glycosyl transferase family 39 [candidate division WWE3 bacterium GW2011_GWC1_41_7]